jgi:hypothetical protein
VTELPKISSVKRSKNMSPENRQKLSELAKERHRTGVWGPQKSRTPEAIAKAAETRRKNRKKTAADHVAESAAQHAADIVAVFQAAIDSGQPMGTRLKAAQAWLDVEQENRKLDIKEEAEDAKQHSRDELIAILAEKLTAGPAAELLRKQLESEVGVIDAEVVAEDVVPAEAATQ